jgi:WD40 repeat protein
MGGSHRKAPWEPATTEDDPVFGLAFSPDGKLLAIADRSNTVQLWDVGAGKPARAPLTGHAGIVRSVAFSPDGKLLATGSDDKTVRLWNPATGQPAAAPLTGHTGPVNALAFSPDGKTLATGSADHTVRLWDATLYADPFARICTQFGSPTPAEWRQQVRDEPLPPVCP